MAEATGPQPADILPVQQASAEMVVTRQTGISHERGIATDVPLDPVVQDEAPGLGSKVTRQSGVMVVDAQVSGTLKADRLPEGGQPRNTFTDRSLRPESEGSSVALEGHNSLAEKPVAGGELDVSRVKEAIKEAPVDESAKPQVTDVRAATGVHFAPGTPGLSDEQLAAFKEGRAPTASTPAGQPVPVAADKTDVKPVETKSVEPRTRRPRGETPTETIE